MTLAEQVTGGVVGKLGSALSGLQLKLSRKNLLLRLAQGIHLTDNSWQEVASSNSREREMINRGMKV